MTTAVPTLSLRTAVDVLTAVPYVLGFHPHDSVVLLGLGGSRLIVQARADADPGVPAEALAEQVIGLLPRSRVDATMLVGYGPAGLVEPVLAALRDRLAGVGLPVWEVLRTQAGRYWSLLCQDRSCCPAEGIRYDPTGTVVAAQATLAGLVALPSRRDLERSLAPVTGPAAEAMAVATARARQRLADLVVVPRGGAGAVVPVALRALRLAVARHRAGGRLDDDEAAWLCVVLTHTRVRDIACELAGRDPAVHAELWRDLTRRADPALVPAVATVAAFTAWRLGEGTVAAVAVDRALTADPRYPLALLLREAISAGLPPSVWSGPGGRPTRRRPAGGQRGAR